MSNDRAFRMHLLSTPRNGVADGLRRGPFVRFIAASLMPPAGERDTVRFVGPVAWAGDICVSLAAEAPSSVLRVWHPLSEREHLS